MTGAGEAALDMPARAVEDHGPDWTAKITAYIEAHQAELIELAQSLIRIPSVFGAEGPCQEFVAGYLAGFADEVHAWELDATELERHPAYFPRGVDYTGRTNVVGVAKGAKPGRGRSLLLNGHIDVVDPGPAGRWTYAPWSATVADGRLHGRGAADMKAGVAVGLFCLKAVKVLGIPLAGDLIMTSVADEEWGGGGTISACQRGFVADGAVLLEPTGNEICAASRGGMAFRITVPGRGAHPARAYLGVSAIEKAFLVILALKRLEAARQERLRTPVFADFPVFAPICVGRISADEMSSKVPEKCVMEGLFGYAPGEEYQEARREFEECVRAAAAEDPWLSGHPPVVEWIGLNKEGAATPCDHPFVAAMRESFQAALGRAGTVTALTCGCDYPHLVKHAGMPGVIFGPGDCTVAHTTDEYVEVREVIEAAKVLGVMIVKWCLPQAAGYGFPG